MNPTDNNADVTRVRHRDRDSDGRPIDPPRPVRREFRELMREHSQSPQSKKSTKHTDNDDEDVSEYIAETTEESPSPLTLISGKKKATKATPDSKEEQTDTLSPYKAIAGRGQQEQEAQANAEESPFSVYKQIANKTKNTPPPLAWEAMTQSELPRPAARSDSEKTGKASSRFAQDQADASYVNPYATTSYQAAAITDSSSALQGASRIAAITELVEQLVDKMYTLQKGGTTETIVELKFPPDHIFEGARVVISSFDSATKEFNLAFENLRPDAKQLIDLNMNDLRTNMEEKGFANAVQIITTTTYIERNLPSDRAFARGDERDDRGSKDGEQREGRSKK